MTSSATRVENSGGLSPKLQVERGRVLASKTVILGAIFTGPQLLFIIHRNAKTETIYFHLQYCSFQQWLAMQADWPPTGSSSVSNQEASY